MQKFTEVVGETCNRFFINVFEPNLLAADSDGEWEQVQTQRISTTEYGAR